MSILPKQIGFMAGLLLGGVMLAGSADWNRRSEQKCSLAPLR
jgi:hypothetical protein